MKKIFQNKKAQITIFIIIGIILLFSSALIFSIKNKISKTSSSPIVISQTLPDELLGLNKYIDDCLYQTGKEAVITLGGQGGYIHPEEFGIVGDTNDPTEGSGLIPFPTVNDYIIPYWFYLSSPNDCNSNCEFDFYKKPQKKGNSPNSMETQISRFIEKNMQYCIQDFQAYKQKGYNIKELGDLSVKTSITREDVVLIASWPLEAGMTNQKKIDSFAVHLPVKLGEVYDFAQQITYLHQNKSVIETNTLNIVLSYLATQLPSTGTMTYNQMFSPSKDLTWSYKKTKKIIENALGWYVSIFRVKNTLNGQRMYFSDRMVQAVNDKMIIETFSNESKPYAVTFTYNPSWPIYYDVTPRKGDEIKGNSFNGFGILNFIGLGIKQYEFQYDISYPVMVQITDPYAFNGEGYDFVFALEANIRNNKVLTPSFYSLDVTSAANSFVCDEAQKKSGNITVYVNDASSNSSVPDASISLFFGREGCVVGTTDEKGISTERYPSGIGQLIVSKKPEYLTSTKLYGVGVGDTDRINVTLYPIIEKKISIKRYIITKNYTIDRYGNYLCRGWEFQSSNISEDISADETVSILIKKVKSFNAPDDISANIEYNGSIGYDNQLIKIGPGFYEVDIVNLLYKNISIPAQSKTYSNDDDDVTISFEEMSQYPYNAGKLKFAGKSLDNEPTSEEILLKTTKRANMTPLPLDQLKNQKITTPSTFYLEVKPDELYADNVLEFYALDYDLDSVPMECRKAEPNDFIPTPSPEDFLKIYKKLLTPKFVKET